MFKDSVYYSPESEEVLLESSGSFLNTSTTPYEGEVDYSGNF